MPPKIKYDKDGVIDAALRVARADGFAAVNARSIARELGSSTQPLFREFKSMDDIRAGVAARAAEIYYGYIERGTASTDIAYKGAGLAYIRFATEEPELFKLLFMHDARDGSKMPAGGDKSIDGVIDTIVAKTGYSRDTALDFHMKMWIFTHGIAVMAATGLVSFTDAQLDGLLSEQYSAMKLLYDSRGKQGKNDKI